MAVGAHVDVVDPDLARLDASVAVAKVDVAAADRLHLGAQQRDTSLEGLEDMVVVEGLPILRDAFLRLFPLSPHSLTGGLLPPQPPTPPGRLLLRRTRALALRPPV